MIYIFQYMHIFRKLADLNHFQNNVNRGKNNDLASLTYMHDFTCSVSFPCALFVVVDNGNYYIRS